MNEDRGAALKSLRWIAGIVIFCLVLFSLFRVVSGDEETDKTDESSRIIIVGSEPENIEHLANGSVTDVECTAHPCPLPERKELASSRLVARARKCGSDVWGNFEVSLSDVSNGLNLCADNTGEAGFFVWERVYGDGDLKSDALQLACIHCSRLKLSNVEAGVYLFRLTVTPRLEAILREDREATPEKLSDTSLITVTVSADANDEAISDQPLFSGEHSCSQPNVIDGWWIAESPSLLDNMRQTSGSSFKAYPDGVVLILRCNEGTELSDGGTMKCTNGKWNPDPETVCVKEKKRCTFPSSANANIEILRNTDPRSGYRIRSGLIQGSEIRMRCNVGKYFLLIQDHGWWKEGRFLCGADGAWKVQRLADGSEVQVISQLLREDLTVWNPECTTTSETACPSLQDSRLIRTAEVYVHYPTFPMTPHDDADGGIRYPEGTVASLGCRRSEFKLHPRHSERRRCLSNGTWEYDGRVTYCQKPMGCEHLKSGGGLKYAYINDECEPSRPECIYTTRDRSRETLLRPGTRARFECYNNERYRLIGEMLVICGSDGEWDPKERPICELENRCQNPQFPTNGFFTGGEHTMSRFVPGHQLEFGCAKGYSLEGPTAIRCLTDGSWSNGRPKCNADQWSNKRFIAMTIVGGLLGILLVILLTFLIHRQRMIRRAQARRRRLVDHTTEPRLSASHVIAAAGRRSSAGAREVSAVGNRLANGVTGLSGRGDAQRLTAGDWMDPDRLALIAFAEGNGLPSYEEAVTDVISSRRGPPPFDAVSTLSGYASRAVRRLPSLSSLRSREVGLCSGNGHGAVDPRDPHTGSGSNVSHGAISGQIGSAETMGTSDGSTAVTLETLSTSTGNTPSVRAQAGSLSSVEPPSMGDGSGSQDGIPLLAPSQEVQGVEEVVDDSAQSDFGGVREGMDNVGVMEIERSLSLTERAQIGMEMLEAEDKNLEV